MGLFSRKKTSGGDKGAAATADEGFKRDPRKARRFFEHAQATADSRQYDYSIECYINGLKHDPDNMGKHEALQEVAMRRKATGGKPAGLTERMKSPGKDPVDRMLHAEMLWAKDPVNVKLMRDFMRRAVEADDAEPELNLGEVANWIGCLALEWNANAKKPDKTIFLDLRDLFEQIRMYEKAIEACKYALQMDPDNSPLVQALKDLEAEHTMHKGRYGDNFRDSVKDIDKQQALDQEDRIAKTESAVDEMIQRRRAEFDEDPQDLDRVQKLVDALLHKQTNETEAEAIKLLKDAWESTGQYRYRVKVGDIQMRQIARYLRQLKAKLDAAPDNRELRQKYDESRRKRVLFELNEYTDRVKNYPTDLALRYELGVRLYATGKIDDAISAFQQAKAEPKHRAAAHHFLGRCYIDREWFEEAIDTLNEGIEAHPLRDDNLGLELRYLLMDAHERLARKSKNLEHARTAQKVASQVLQANINFKDIRERMETLRKLVEELSGG